MGSSLPESCPETARRGKRADNALAFSRAATYCWHTLSVRPCQSPGQRGNLTTRGRGDSFLRVHLINPSHLAFGVGVITPRWLYVLAAATPAHLRRSADYGRNARGSGPADDSARRRRRHRHPYRQRAARVRGRAPRPRARRVGRVRRHSRDAVSRGAPRARRGARRRQRRRRHRVGTRRQRLRGRHAEAGLRRGQGRRRLVPGGAVGPHPAQQIHVGLGADRPRLPEALFVLLGVEDGRAEAPPAHRRRGDWRGRRAAPPGVPVHRARGRQFLYGHAHRHQDGGAPGGSGAAHLPRGAPRRALRADGEAREDAERHDLLHADHDGGGRGSGVSGRDAQGAHQGRARRRRGGDAGRD